MPARSVRIDRDLGWFLASKGERLPYRANQKGVFFIAPNEVIGADLRKAKEPENLAFSRPPGFILDGESAATVLGHVLSSGACPSCKSLDLAKVAGDQIACNGCGGMFELDVFTKESAYPVAVEWAARLEGSWKVGAEHAVIAHGPAMISSEGAQATRAAIAVAGAVPLAAFAPGGIDDAAFVALGAQPKMRALHLWFNRSLTSAGLHVLATYTSLTHLNLGNNPNVDDDAARHVATLSSLRTFEAEQTKIGDAGLTQIAKLRLETLILNSAPITDDGLAALKGHPTLRLIAIGWTCITDEGIRHLATIPNIEEIRVFDGKLKEYNVEGSILRREHLGLPSLPPHADPPTPVSRAR